MIATRTSAADHGRICAVAARCGRDLQRCAETYPELFAGRPFDPTLFGTVALANAFGSPGLTADRLEIANRTSLWIFALDWLVDHRATAPADVAELLAGCRAVADGTPPGDEPLARFLADIRDRLATAPGYAAFVPAWRDELDRMLTAMVRELEWKTRGDSGRPSFEEYLANADNFGSVLVNVGHWIFTSDPAALARLDGLRAASRTVQQVLRLLNDLATYDRDTTWGDLNALLLGLDAERVREHIAALVDRAAGQIAALRPDCPAEADYLERQIGYSTGFYGTADYWGTL